MKASSVARQMLGPMLASVTMLLVVSSFRTWPALIETGQALKLAAAILVGFATYTTFALVFLRPAITATLELLNGKGT
jgi:hypothetical protein